MGELADEGPDVVQPSDLDDSDILMFSEEALVFMDLAKTLAWKHLYEDVIQVVRTEHRNLVTRDDVASVLGAALAGALAELRLTIAEVTAEPGAESSRAGD